MATHLKKFYNLIGLPLNQFNLRVETEFVNTLTKSQISGGSSTRERKIAIQEAVNALVIYKELGYPNGTAKIAGFRQAVLCYYKEKHFPSPSPSVRAVVDNMKKIEAHYNILMKKFMLLDYWQAVAVGTVEAEYPKDGNNWAVHEFLQFDSLKVRPILELMLNDAKSILSKPYSTSLETWRGAKAEKSLEFTKDSMSMTIKAETTLQVGVEVKGEFEMEYTGFKMKANAELFAGARGHAEGEMNLTATRFDAKGEVEIEVAIRVKGNVEVNVLDILEAEAGVDAIAGAMAKAGVEISMSNTGVALKASAEAFAGAKITGTAKGTLKFGGRAILSGKAEASATAGVGASAGADFSCDLFGKVSLGAKAGVTTGLGAESAANFSVDFHNIKWGSANLFWAAINQAGFKNKGKVWFLPVDENVKMCLTTRDALYKEMANLYNNNEAEIAKLEVWNALETKVSTSVESHNPKLKQLSSQRRNAIVSI